MQFQFRNWNWNRISRIFRAGGIGIELKPIFSGVIIGPESELNRKRLLPELHINAMDNAWYKRGVGLDSANCLNPCMQRALNCFSIIYRTNWIQIEFQNFSFVTLVRLIHNNYIGLLQTVIVCLIDPFWIHKKSHTYMVISNHLINRQIFILGNICNNQKPMDCYTRLTANTLDL